jgi:hypothetical protein
MNCTPADYQLQKSVGLTTDRNRARLPSLFGMKFIQQRNWRSKSDNRSMGTCKGAFPPHILQKQRRPSALQTMNCTPADYRLQKSVGLTTDRNRARLPSLFVLKFTQVPSQYSKGIGEVKVTIEVWVHAKVPSCRLSCESSAALQLFKQ